MLAGAHAFETFGDMAPCALCLKQREIYWGAATLALAALVLVRRRPDAAGFANLALGLVFLVGAGVAAYHVAVEHHLVIARCDADLDLSAIAPLGASGTLDIPRCDQPAWTMFGISMAGYNALLSLVYAGLSFFAARSARHA